MTPRRAFLVALLFHVLARVPADMMAGAVATLAGLATIAFWITIAKDGRAFEQSEQRAGHVSDACRTRYSQ